MPIVNQFGPSPALLAAVARQSGLLQGHEEQRQQRLAELNQAANTISGAIGEFQDRRRQGRLDNEAVARDNRNFGFEVQQADQRQANTDRAFGQSQANADRAYGLDQQQQNRLDANTSADNALNVQRTQADIAAKQGEDAQKKAYQDQQLKIAAEKNKIEADKSLFKENRTQWTLQKNAEIDNNIQQVQASPLLRDSEKQAATQMLEQQRPPGNREQMSAEQKALQGQYVDPSTGITMQTNQKTGVAEPAIKNQKTTQELYMDALKTPIGTNAEGKPIYPSADEAEKIVYKAQEVGARAAQRAKLINDYQMRGEPLPDNLDGPPKKPTLADNAAQQDPGFKERRTAAQAMPDGEKKTAALDRSNQEAGAKPIVDRIPPEELQKAVSENYSPVQQEQIEKVMTGLLKQGREAKTPEEKKIIAAQLQSFQRFVASGAYGK